VKHVQHGTCMTYIYPQTAGGLSAFTPYQQKTEICDQKYINTYIYLLNAMSAKNESLDKHLKSQ